MGWQFWALIFVAGVSAFNGWRYQGEVRWWSMVSLVVCAAFIVMELGLKH